MDISKHLMLLFIGFSPTTVNDLFVFQNISCYCLSHLQFVVLLIYLNFKTSHVIVYHAGVAQYYTVQSGFQNISCYCLSSSPKEPILFKINFKTSHVIVYRIREVETLWILYISKHLMLLFIDINAKSKHWKKISKHLMLLFIFLQIDLKNILCQNFKTSHVIVYQSWRD